MVLELTTDYEPDALPHVKHAHYGWTIVKRAAAAAFDTKQNYSIGNNGSVVRYTSYSKAKLGSVSGVSDEHRKFSFTLCLSDMRRQYMYLITPTPWSEVQHIFFIGPLKKKTWMV